MDVILIPAMCIFVLLLANRQGRGDWSWGDVTFGLFAASALGFFFGYNIWGEDGALPLAAFNVAIGIAAFREGNKAAKRKVDEHSNVR